MSAELLAQDWDAVIIGTGMGGGTIGHVLAEAGFKVLFLEKGPAGYRAESTPITSPAFEPQARLLRGLWPEAISATVDGREASFFAPLGAGVGGSSVFYAATLERPERHDMEGAAHPTGGWPVSFDEMSTFYGIAEAMYDVAGQTDPLSPESDPALQTPPPLSPTDQGLMDELTAAGLHPYRLHSALRYDPGCENCLGRKCPRSCKRDGRSAGVEPALATGNAALVTECEVVALHGSATEITGLTLRMNGETHDITPRRVILAGGALGSAHLLLRSTSDTWPDGIANRSGLVGRNLMFHLNEMFALWPRAKSTERTASKAISLRDLYHMDGQRFGTVQSMGIDAGYGEILHYLRLMLARSRFGGSRLASELARIPATFAHRIMGEAQIFVGLLEDIGYSKNRVRFDPNRPDTLTLDYTLDDELRTRRKAFRRAIKRALKSHRTLFLSQSPELNFGHPCGTARFGTDAKTSVLRLDCRSHDVANLWVVDSSFMPSSFGVNPTLTIAANAIRVGETLIKEWQS